MDGLYNNDEHLRHLHAVSGIDGLRVSLPDVDSAAPEFGMPPRDLTLFVHGMLRLAGVPVVAEDDGDAPTLHTTLSVHKVVDLYSVTISVELWDRVWLTRQTHGHSLRAATWRRSASLVSNRHELRDNTRMELGNLVTGFLNDYIAANRSDSRAAG